MLVVGIDPGTGSSSPTALVAFDPITKRIHAAKLVGHGSKYSWVRINNISRIVGEFFKQLEYEASLFVVCENFYMRGKGGETLQRMIGGYVAQLRQLDKWHEVQNTTVKKHLTGTGRATKDQVAESVKAWFASSVDSTKLLKHFSHEENNDIFDAFAIGISGYERHAKK